MEQQQSRVARERAGPGMREFVALMAALMASNAMAIDAMLPALPAIGDTLGVAEENQRQLVITSYLLGFGFSQLLFGPLSDRFGRRTILVVTLGFYAMFALACGLATSFSMLLVARALQGVAAAGTRVLVVSIVRDRYEGAAMARVMSLVFIIFMIVPVMAPAFGQAVLAVASWRFIFIGLGLYGAAVLVWSLLRLPETLPPEKRRALSVRQVSGAVLTTLSIRASVGNMTAMMLVMGGLFAFINSIQQIVFDVFGQPEQLALVFAAIAGPLAVTSWANSRLVERLGSRRILLPALIALTALASLHALIAWTMEETLLMFTLMQAATTIWFGLIFANLGAIAMQPLGHIAGTASSVQGVVTTVGGALIGLSIGQMFDGTTLPFLIGFALCAAAALAVALWANPAPKKEPVRLEV